MSPEAPTFAPEPRQPGTDALANLFDSLERRDALIDRVVSFDATRPNTTVLETPVVFDSSVIDVIPPESRVQGPAKKRRLTGLRNLVAGGTAIVAGLTAAGGTSPALAGGFKIEQGAINTTAECVTDPNLMTVNRPYADQIASGKVVIAAGPPPIAALEEGDKTAEAITSISVEEALKNLLIPAPECPPKEIKTPEPMPTAEDLLTALINQKGKEIKEVSFQELEDKVSDILNHDNYREALAAIEIPYSGGDFLTKAYIKDALERIKYGGKKGNKDPESYRIEAREGYAANLGVALILGYDKTTIPELKVELSKAADMAVDYSLGIDPDHPKKNNDYVDRVLIATGQTYINYPFYFSE